MDKMTEEILQTIIKTDLREVINKEITSAKKGIILKIEWIVILLILFLTADFIYLEYKLEKSHKYIESKIDSLRIEQINLPYPASPPPLNK